MTDARQKLGESGEELACGELTARGYAILERRYRTKHGEIDIVAKDHDTLVFVEVKMKSSPEFGLAVEAITPWKQRRVARMAIDYLARHSLLDHPVRFDVVAIDVIDNTPRITVIAGAFDAV